MALKDERREKSRKHDTIAVSDLSFSLSPPCNINSQPSSVTKVRTFSFLLKNHKIHTMTMMHRRYLTPLLLTAPLLMATSISAFAPGLSSSSSYTNVVNKRYETEVAALLLDGQEIRGPITPLGNFVLVQTKDTLAATGGGILLPDQVR